MARGRELAEPAGGGRGTSLGSYFSEARKAPGTRRWASEPAGKAGRAFEGMATVPWGPDGERLDPATGELRGYLPKSVRRCMAGRSIVVRWRLDGSGAPVVTGYECGSWRCPSCRRKVAAADFARLSQAIRDRSDWVYLVLTCDSARFSSRWSAWKALGHAWRDRLRNRLARRYGRLEYVQTWEQTRKGAPHVNVILHGARLLEHVDELGWKPGRDGRRVLRWRRELREHAGASGFGRVVWVDRLWTPSAARPDPSEAMAGYLVKLAAELGDHTGKAEQTPTSAPPGFRRIRATPKLLPPRRLGRSAEPGAWGRLVTSGAVEPWTWRDVDARLPGWRENPKRLAQTADTSLPG